MIPQQQSNRVNESTPLGRAINAFLLDCAARNLTPGTLRFYWQRLATFLVFCERHGATEPARLSPTLLREFIASFSAHSPYYQHQHARAVKTFCSFLVREGSLPASPMAAVRMPKLPKDILEPFQRADVAALLAAAESARDKAVILMLLDTGVRASELLALDVGDYDALTGAIRVRHGKGRKLRTVFVGAHTRHAIGRYLADRGSVSAVSPLFAAEHGGRLAFFGLASLLGRLGRAAGVKPVGAHRFRRTFAIESLRAGMPLPQLAALMGHEGLAVLQRYLRLVTDDLQAAHQQHGAVDRLLQKGR